MDLEDLVSIYAEMVQSRLNPTITVTSSCATSVVTVTSTATHVLGPAGSVNYVPIYHRYTSQDWWIVLFLLLFHFMMVIGFLMMVLHWANDCGIPGAPDIVLLASRLYVWSVAQIWPRDTTSTFDSAQDETGPTADDSNEVGSGHLESTRGTSDTLSLEKRKSIRKAALNDVPIPIQLCVAPWLCVSLPWMMVIVLGWWYGISSPALPMACAVILRLVKLSSGILIGYMIGMIIRKIIKKRSTVAKLDSGDENFEIINTPSGNLDE